MPGTIEKELQAAQLADATAMTSGPGNTGFDSSSIGAGNTATHQTGARMGRPAGYRLTQAAANQNNWFLDLAAQRAQLAFRIPFSAPTPAATLTFFRTFSDLAHAVNIGQLAYTTTRRLQYLEQGTGGLNVTSPSGALALVADADYVIHGLLDVTANTAEIHCYDLGVLAPRFTLSGALAADSAAAAGFRSIRWGIGTASAIASIDTSSGFAIGDGAGGHLARYDVNLTATLSATPLLVEAGQTVTVDAVAPGATGRTWRVAAMTNGVPAPTLNAGANADQKTFRAPVTRDGTTVTIGYLPAGAPAAEAFLNITVLPVTTVAGAARWPATGVVKL